MTILIEFLHEAADRCGEVSELTLHHSATASPGRKKIEHEAEELAQKLWSDMLPRLQAILSSKADAEMGAKLTELQVLLRDGPKHAMALEEGVSILLGWAATLARIKKILLFLYWRLKDISQNPSAGQILVTTHAINTLNIGNQGSGNVSSSKYDININASTIGAHAVGDHATATGTVILGGSVSRERFDGEIRAMKKALIDDEDSLDTVVIDALHQFLRISREIQIENKTLSEAQTKMKEILDEIWAEKTIKPMLPPGTRFAVELLKSPVMAEAAKALLGGGA